MFVVITCLLRFLDVDWRRSPYFTDADGQLTFIFKGAGKIEPVEVLDRFTVESWAPRVIGFERIFDNFLSVPPTGSLTWVREPATHSFSLPTLPASILACLRTEPA